MDNVLIKCTAKSAVYKKLTIISSIILIIPSLMFLFLNIYASIILSSIYIVVIYIIINIDNFCLTDDGVYVCKRNGSVIYGYKYFEIECVDIIHAGNSTGLKIVNNGFKESHLLVIRDKTKIIVPEYVNNFHVFLSIINNKINDKLSSELKEYIEANISDKTMDASR